MNRTPILPILLFVLTFNFILNNLIALNVTLFPANNAVNVNPDVQLKITFPGAPVLGNSGKIRVYDASTDELVDSLDMSIAPGPRNTRTPSPYDTIVYPGIPDKTYTVYDPDTDTSHVYQINYIGGTSDYDACHFYPVLFHDNTATIFLHNNHLDYNKAYYITIDKEVFPFNNEGFSGINGKTTWGFSTKTESPLTDEDSLVVSADGTGDFNTLQGAIDFIPVSNTTPRTIYIKNGIYDEMIAVQFKNKITVIGEDREKTKVQYPNNGVFNKRRYEFYVKADDINLLNFSIISVGVAPAQAEGLCMKGDKNQVHNVTIDASGDAVQAAGRMYMNMSSIKGFGDNVLGYGIFFNECDFISTYGPHLWPRNDNSTPGYVLVNCKLWGEKGLHAAPYNSLNITYARAPIKDSYSYPYAEAVLINCAVADLMPVGFGETSFACEDSRYWEYNTVNMSDGSPADYSKRAPYSKQLTIEEDSLTIANYSNPIYVLDGWTPEYVPVIFSQPDTVTAMERSKIEIGVKIGAAPYANFRWYKNGELLENEKASVLKIDSITYGDEGDYSVSIENYLGNDSSQIATLVVEEYISSVPSININKNYDIKIYPNPADHVLNILYTGNTPVEVDGSIIDIAGKKVLAFNQELSYGAIKSLNLSRLKTGNYVVLVKNSDFLLREKLSILR